MTHSALALPHQSRTKRSFHRCYGFQGLGKSDLRTMSCVTLARRTRNMAASSAVSRVSIKSCSFWATTLGGVPIGLRLDK